MRAGLVLMVALAAACNSDDHGHGVNPDEAIVVNEASDEVLIAMADAVDEGRLEMDDTLAFHLVTPAEGASVPAATPPKFQWAAVGSTQAGARHGVTSGTFHWLRFEAEGLSEPVDVIAVMVTEWTPSADEWARLTAATGPIKVTVTSAYAMSGIVKQGPWRATDPDSTFSIE